MILAEAEAPALQDPVEVCGGGGIVVILAEAEAPGAAGPLLQERDVLVEMTSESRQAVQDNAPDRATPGVRGSCVAARVPR